MKTKQRHFIKSDKIIARTSKDIDSSVLTEKVKAFNDLLGAKTTEERPRTPSIISSSEGKIERIFMTIPSYAIVADEDTQNPYWSAFSNLILQLPEHTTFFLLTHKSVINDLNNWLTKNNLTERAHIKEIDNHLHFSVWAQDAYAITKNNDNDIYFAEPYSFPRYADGLMAGKATNFKFKTYKVPLYFQGGNILIGDNFFFIGADYPKNSLDYVDNVVIPEKGESKEAFIKRLYSEYLDTSKKLYYIGSRVPVPHQVTRKIKVGGEDWEEILYFGNKKGTVQPLFHIDMFLSFAGRNKKGKFQILVGSPEMAAELVDELSVSLPYAMQEVFDDIASGLAENPDFEIIRNPLPLVYMDDCTKKNRYWYFATANNCLIENDGDKKTVWLPTYGHGDWFSLSITDQKNKDIWETLGYKVNLLADFHPFAENLGAVHCVTKYLSRSS